MSDDAAPPPRFLYIFLDEGGNLDFSQKGTRFFTMTSMTKERPFAAYRELTDLKYDLLEGGFPLEYFHCAENVQAVRDRVFDIIRRHLDGIHIDTVVVEKSEAPLELREERVFYPAILGYLLAAILSRTDLTVFQEIIVVTDTLPMQRKRKAIEAAIKETLADMLPPGARYRLVHHNSKSNFDLQIADYINWAIYRKYERGDERSYVYIASAMRLELNPISALRLYLFKRQSP